MRRRLIHTLLTLFCLTLGIHAQHYQLAGTVVDAESGQAVEYASVLLAESGLWAVTNERGGYQMKNVPAGRTTITVQCLGYEKRTMTITINRDVADLRLKLKQQNLKLSEVTVVARRKQDEATTSYTINRQALDQQQLLNLSDVGVLLPGGKTVNPTLMDDNRMALRSSSQEKGNASFGTAIEIDGMRLDNNAMSGETLGSSTRTVSTSDVESVEIVTGIPSVEYGDLSNGVVKVQTRRGKSPFIVEGKLNQHTRQIAVNKGFECLGRACPLVQRRGLAPYGLSAQHPQPALLQRIPEREYPADAEPRTDGQRGRLQLGGRPRQRAGRLYQGARQCLPGQPRRAMATQQTVDYQPLPVGFLLL